MAELTNQRRPGILKETGAETECSDRGGIQCYSNAQFEEIDVFLSIKKYKPILTVDQKKTKNLKNSLILDIQAKKRK